MTPPVPERSWGSRCRCCTAVFCSFVRPNRNVVQESPEWRRSVVACCPRSRALRYLDVELVDASSISEVVETWNRCQHAGRSLGRTRPTGGEPVLPACTGNSGLPPARSASRASPQGRCRVRASDLGLARSRLHVFNTATPGLTFAARGAAAHGAGSPSIAGEISMVAYMACSVPRPGSSGDRSAGGPWC